MPMYLEGLLSLSDINSGLLPIEWTKSNFCVVRMCRKAHSIFQSFKVLAPCRRISLPNLNLSCILCLHWTHQRSSPSMALLLSSPAVGLASG